MSVVVKVVVVVMHPVLSCCFVSTLHHTIDDKHVEVQAAWNRGTCRRLLTNRLIFEGTVSAYPTPNVLPTFRECGNPAVMFSNNLEHAYTVAGSYYS